MDFILQRRFYMTVLAVLLVLNIGTVTMLWLGHDRRRDDPGHRPPPLEHLLKRELNFSDSQVLDFMELRDSHVRQIHVLEDRMRRMKRELFQAALQDDAVMDRDLLEETQAVQNEIEALTFDYLHALFLICSPEQRHDLKKITHFLMNPPQNREPGPPRP